MNNLNYILFEEYKQLEKLCSEIYGEPHGISHYIDDMKKVPLYEYRNLPNWQIDLTCLKQIRHIRNYLAHTQGAFDETVCTENDINWIRDFHDRLLNQSDPLAILYQHSKTKQQKKIPAKPVSQSQISLPPAQYYSIEESLPETDTEENHPTNDSFSIFSLFAVIIVIGVLVLAAFCIYSALSI